MINAMLLSKPLWSRLTVRYMLWWNEAHEHARPVQTGCSSVPISRPESSRPSCRRTAVPDLRPGKYCTHPLTSVPDFRRIRKIVPACRCPINGWPSSLQGLQACKASRAPAGDKVPHRRHKSKNLVSLTQAKTFMPHSECFAKTLGPAQMRCVAAVQPPEKQEGSLPAI